MGSTPRPFPTKVPSELTEEQLATVLGWAPTLGRLGKRLLTSASREITDKISLPLTGTTHPTGAHAQINITWAGGAARIVT
ncbi:hypothetical protein ElyMa_003378200 [Elysia marginata]|uniref:Uncharacterized protein n=1 Tax=Elysia marginata TaxID=1093978 RepID=A0AAV4JM70_9GAST|nr:hypothetical protein ElyMa_003378200 [Elysia marginata]